MKQFRSYIYQSSADFTRAMLWEAKYIFRDKAVFFSFVIVAVVSLSCTPTSIPKKHYKNSLLEWLMRIIQRKVVSYCV